MKAELLSTIGASYVEKPWHRLAVKLHLDGWTNYKIAEELRQSTEDVTALLVSKEIRSKIAEAIEQDEAAVAKILEAAGLDSVYRLIDLRDNATSESVRLNAAKCLLEHGYGKAITRTKTMDGDSSADPLAEAEQLKEELLQNDA